MNNIFTEMRIPQLGDPTFQTDFNTFCEAIKQNIERLISVQYTKGEPGNSVYTIPVHVGYTSTGVGNLTSLSAGILNAIFGTNEFDTTKTPQDVNDIIAGSGIGMMVDNDYFTNGELAPSIVVDGVEYKAIPSLMGNRAGFDIEINVDDITGEAYLASPYIFIDNRIAGLNRMVRRHAHNDEIYKTFVDFSVAIYGKGTYVATNQSQDPHKPETWNWTFEAVQIVPKLYFDDRVDEFCWDVNGQQTGITAQGIKGDDGISPSMLIAIGSKNGSVITFSKIQAIDDEGRIEWASKNNDGIWGYQYNGEFVEIEQPKANDIALVFFPSGDHISGNPDNPYEYAYLGKVYVSSAGVYTYIGFDEDGRCDIFESIKLHDYWTLMLNINSYSTGAPRGYILPAEPESTTVDPNTKPTKVHMTYSERGRGHSDRAGFSKLHSAPIDRNGQPDPTKMSQTDNPQADHIGDWQVDYNMGIQGNTAVQGTMFVQGDATFNNNVTIKKDVYVQGGMTVQGTIIGQSFTVTGNPFGTVIGTPKVACMSRFKDVSYSLKRSINSRNKSFGYNVLISGVLELNIGVLSSFNQSACITSPHTALSGYGPNWRDDGPYSEARATDAAATNAFDATNCRQRSKLYNVVKYEIPFDISKEVETGALYNTSNSTKNIFGFGYYSGKTPLNQTPHTIFQDKSTRGEISLRAVVEGFNKKTLKLNGSSSNYTVYGSEIIRTTDVDGILYMDINDSCSTVLDYIPSTVTADQTKVNSAVTNGIIRKMTDQADSQRKITQSSAQTNYSIYGKLRYAPYLMEFEYYFDLFPRIFEIDYTTWKRYKGTDSHANEYFCSDLDYNIFLDIVPVGFVRYKQNTNEFHVPIWNAINVNNERSNSIRANISGLLISNLPNITLYDEAEEEAQQQSQVDKTNNGSGNGSGTVTPNDSQQEQQSGNSSTEMSSGGSSSGSGTGTASGETGKDETSEEQTTRGGAKGGDRASSDDESSSPSSSSSSSSSEASSSTVVIDRGTSPQPDVPQTVSDEFYTVANALISSMYKETFSQSKNSNAINGPQSVILSGEDIESQYIISVFDNPSGKSIECLTVENLRANYFDITPSLRIVENNVKICPNNVYRGTWKWNNNENAICWESAEPVPVVIIPYEGYIGSYNAGQHQGCAKLGCGNFKPEDKNANGVPVTLNGVLMYPFTPCMIMMTPSNTATSSAGGKEDSGNSGGKEDGDSSSVVSAGGNKGGSGSSINYVIDNITDSQNDALTGGDHLLSNGRMLVTDGFVSGMITMMYKKPPYVPNAYLQIENSIVSQEATAQQQQAVDK